MLRPDELSKPLFISGFVRATLSAVLDRVHIPNYELSDVTPIGAGARPTSIKDKPEIQFNHERPFWPRLDTPGNCRK
jgi:hypothetical protein